MDERVKQCMLSPDASIAEALAQLDRSGTGALLLCGPDERLCGLVTDGDIRRAILRGKVLDEPCRDIATQNPITARSPVTPVQALRIINEHDIHHLPVVDEDGRVQMLLLREDLALGASDGEARQEQRLKDCIAAPGLTISEAMTQLERAGTGALMICDSDRRLLGMLTDGDVRRAILRHISLTTRCELIANRDPITAQFPVSSGAALQLMNEHDIAQLPVIDASGLVRSFLLRKDLAPDADLGLSAVVMAGGFGTRLLPLTEKVPKPMLPVGGRPLLELTIGQLRKAGIKEINLTTHYLPEAISEHFGNGEAFGVRLNYLREEHPLGTAGGLKLLKNTDKTMLVINGDILTGVPFQAMLAFHRGYGADLTVGVRKYEFQVPFGVVECQQANVTGLQEKPSLNFFINAGTYLLEPGVYDFIPDGRRFDMTDLIKHLLEAGKKVVSFPIVEYWLDIGRHEDYRRAQTENQKVSI